MVWPTNETVQDELASWAEIQRLVLEKNLRAVSSEFGRIWLE